MSTALSSPIVPDNYYVRRSGKVLYMPLVAEAWASQGWEMLCRDTTSKLSSKW
jgi:hypothetical protein